MGEAYTALADDATALYWNPAGLASLENTQVHLMHNEWLSSVRQEFVGVAHATEYGGFALGLTGLSMDEIERRDDTPTSTPLGHFSPFDIAVHLGYGKALPRDTEIGFALKWIYSRLDEESTKGFLIDLGLRHKTVIPGLTLGAAILNLGGEFEYIDESFDAPLTVKFGGAYQLQRHPLGEGEIRLAYDLLLLSDSDTNSDSELGTSKSLNARHHFGAEYEFRAYAALRVGYKAGYDSQGLSFGGGMRWGQFVFDYAFLAVDNDLGNAHRMGLSLDL
jgi:hypothetical protein